MLVVYQDLVQLVEPQDRQLVLLDPFINLSKLFILMKYKFIILELNTLSSNIIVF